MRKFKVNLVIIVSLFTYSCDCLQVAHGIIVNSKTKQPILNALIRDQNSISDTTSEYQIHTYKSDSNGVFKYIGMSGGFFGCPKLKLVIEKEGFVKENKVYKACCSRNDTIYLNEISTK